ncbi:hypothetical protein GIB67_011950 [Kingdonia uniflora]|uniref:Cyclin C-terminal domain-containing protein n=1 Tax=Kingdonia uniflora TaxID=39325 RepID=A0A7J7LZX4_9MAGN|nr:hypothetical protein GIB67_011950 [Kingdonia uniflora]
MADVIAFYGGELEKVENDKVKNMWFAKEDEGGGASTSKPRAEESEEKEIEDLLPHTRYKTRLQEVVIFNEPLQVDASSSMECIQGNEVFEELHAKYKESQRMMDAAEAEINYSREVEETKYVFEAKTIQRMKLFVLFKLHWKMNPVTPLSFVDYIIRRLGLKTHHHWEFLNKYEDLLVCVLADYRFVGYLPSVLATAIMLHIINQIEPCNLLEYQN